MKTGALWDQSLPVIQTGKICSCNFWQSLTRSPCIGIRRHSLNRRQLTHERLSALRGEISPLRRRMIEDMTVRNLSPATQRSYLSAVSKFSRYFGRSPDRLHLEDVRAFQVYLGGNGDFLAGIEPDRLCAALFLRRDARPGHGARAHRLCARTAEATGRAERRRGVRFLEAIPSLKSRAALTTVYGAGLRASRKWLSSRLPTSTVSGW